MAVMKHIAIIRGGHPNPQKMQKSDFFVICKRNHVVLKLSSLV